MNSTNEIQETEANVIENTNINQDNQEKFGQEDTNVDSKTETQKNKNEKQTESTKSTQEKVVESPKQTEKPTQVTNKVDTTKNNTQKGEKPKEIFKKIRMMIKYKKSLNVLIQNMELVQAILI